MENITRRRFLKSSALLGLAAMAWKTGFSAKGLKSVVQPYPDIAVISGTNYLANTQKAVEALGGMQRFISSGQRVGLLINSGFEIPGTYVHPDISLAVLKMCFDAGASEVTAIQHVDPAYWDRSPQKSNFTTELEKLQTNTLNQFPGKIENGGFTKRSLPNAVVLIEAEITDKLFDIDVLINVAIGKHHATTLYTGALKNSMGFNTRATNVTFHLNGPAKNDPTYIAQCIADINKFRPANLCIVDCTQFITTGGPGGPGEMATIDKIIAGTNMVAVDALACSYHSLEMTDVPTLVEAQKVGLGPMDYKQLIVFEG